jgi:hypothetical protein
VASQWLVVLGAAIYAVLGTIHLLYTFFGSRLHPRDPALAEAMRRDTPRLTRATTMWKAWVGFNASHSLGAIGFGLMYLSLAGRHMDLLQRSPWFLWFAFGTSLAWLAVAIPYWFRIPIGGLAIASTCFALALVLLPA